MSSVFLRIISLLAVCAGFISSRRTGRPPDQRRFLLPATADGIQANSVLDRADLTFPCWALSSRPQQCQWREKKTGNFAGLSFRFGLEGGVSVRRLPASVLPRCSSLSFLRVDRAGRSRDPTRFRYSFRRPSRSRVSCATCRQRRR